MLATKENFARRVNYLNQQHCMSAMLAAGVITPIVNENDTVSLTELMFTDNDELSGLIATMMSADRLIILSNIDGLYTGDPADPASRLIARVEPGYDPSEHIAASKSSLGRGGMVSKCRISRRVAAEGIEVVVANGKREGVIGPLAGLGGDVPHTLFAASARPASGVKKWIAHSDSFAKGMLTVNDGAAEAPQARSKPPRRGRRSRSRRVRLRRHRDCGRLSRRHYNSMGSRGTRRHRRTRGNRASPACALSFMPISYT